MSSPVRTSLLVCGPHPVSVIAPSRKLERISVFFIIVIDMGVKTILVYPFSCIMQEENSLIGFIEMLPMFFVLFSEGESLD